MSNTSAFASVNTLPKKQPQHLNPRATQYGMSPIWIVPTKSTDFYVWEMPANSVFPFRPFTGEVVRDLNDKILIEVERMPADQILDMYSLNQFFVELNALSSLNDESKVEAVINVLQNPKVCDKYPVELGTQCAFCRVNDLLTYAPKRIQEAFAGNQELLQAATDTALAMKNGLSKAIDEARRRVDVAVRDIDDPKSGKSMFFDSDYLNVFHTHANRPTYKTSTSNADIGTQIADAIKAVAGQKEAPVVDIEAIVAKAVADATAQLRHEMAASQSAQVPAAEVEVKEKPKK